MANSSAPVVVGVDGSEAAINAAIWAVDEAISRNVPLRIVHVTHIEEEPASPEDAFSLEVQYADISADSRRGSEAFGKPVTVETQILWGSPDTALIDESANAAMVCVGSVGIGPFARTVIGSTAAALAEKAHCPVAIIRTPHHPPASGIDWIVAVVEDRADNESVIEHAMNEARLRKAPVLAVGVWQEDLGEMPYDELDRQVDKWKNRYPDVHIFAVATRAGVARFLATNMHESVRLAVIGRADATQVTKILGPHRRQIVPHGECSVLVVH
jgi:nucleotide-binding universal stress UspA family protein